MPVLDRSYVADCEVRGDGSVTFVCSQDQSEWPWLALSAQHPLVIQTQNFWASVGASQALKTRDDSKWSALTWTDWSLGDPHAGTATHGVFRNFEAADTLLYRLELFDAADRLIATINGKGVVFRKRNFENWRDTSKLRAREANAAHTAFTYCDGEALGLSEAEPALIAPLREDSSGLRTQALITRGNGLMPGHPYFSGSGDHVNAPHLSEVARQAVSLASADPTPLILSAEMDMHRYIELGTPFDIAITRTSDHCAALAIRQLGKSCAKISVDWANHT